MDTGDQELNALVGPDDDFDGPSPGGFERFEEKYDYTKSKQTATSHQWAISGDGIYMPVGATTTELPAGIYQTYSAPNGIGLQRMPLISDNIYELPDMQTQAVLREVETFWNSESLYRKHSLLYKRGVLLWGPPGSGKTVTVKLLMKEIMKRNGLVLVANSIRNTTTILKDLRKIEPNRNIILVFEDIDEIIQYNGEAQVLSLLDGEHNVDNVLNIATTNFPDKLGARIINRPSRFDRRIKIGMPEAPARASYLSQATAGELDQKRLDQWVKDTDGMSIAHLRELVAAVFCLSQDYDDVLKRLKDLGQRIKNDSDGFAKDGKLGF